MSNFKEHLNKAIKIVFEELNAMYPEQLTAEILQHNKEVQAFEEGRTQATIYVVEGLYLGKDSHVLPNIHDYSGELYKHYVLGYASLIKEYIEKNE